MSKNFFKELPNYNYIMQNINEMKEMKRTFKSNTKKFSTSKDLY